MRNQKKRKHSGRKTTEHNIIGIDGKLDVYSKTNYSEWDNYRDGYRRVCVDKTKLKPKHISNNHWYNRNLEDNNNIIINAKNKKMLKLRKIKKSFKLRMEKPNDKH